MTNKARFFVMLLGMMLLFTIVAVGQQGTRISALEKCACVHDPG